MKNIKMFILICILALSLLSINGFESSMAADTKPIVILVFDDNLITTYTNVLPILDAKGWRGVVATVPNYVGFDSASMTKAQIQDLSNRGWEIASHGLNHVREGNIGSNLL